MFKAARRRMLTTGGAIVVAAGVAVSATIAYAAVGDGPVITACVDKKGSVRVVDSSATCSVDETRLSWNKEGPVGPAGAPGPAGPKGDPGAASKLAGASGEFGQSGRMTCTGNRQGVLAGDGPEGSSVTESTSYNVKSPRDVATGQASGKRQHGAVTITKPLDRSSPQYFQALVTNETLTSCVLTYYRPAGDGTLQEIYRITLTDASVSDVTLTKGDTRLAGEGPLAEYESISFTFRKIEMLHTPTGTMAVDDWMSQA